MSEAQTSVAEKPKRKRGRPRGSKNKPKMPKDVADRAWKLGNPDYPAYDKARDMSETEKMHLFVLYQRNDHDTRKAAKSMNIDEEGAHAAIMECLRKDPDALNDPDHNLRLSYACDQVMAQAIVKILEQIDNGKLYGRGLVDTVKAAKWLKRDFMKDYEEKGKKVVENESELDTQIKELEARLAKDNRAGGEAAIPETAQAPGGAGGGEALEHNADARQGQTGGAN